MISRTKQVYHEPSQKMQYCILGNGTIEGPHQGDLSMKEKYPIEYYNRAGGYSDDYTDCEMLNILAQDGWYLVTALGGGAGIKDDGTHTFISYVLAKCTNPGITEE